MFDWPNARLYEVLWAYACEFLGDVVPGFRRRCMSRILTERDRLVVKGQCLQADTIFIKFIAQNAASLDALMPLVRGNTTILAVQRSVKSAITSMYSAEMVWYAGNAKFRTPVHRLASDFCEASFALQRALPDADVVADYDDIEESRVGTVLEALGLPSQPAINSRILTRKFLSFSHKSFPFPWHRLACNAAHDAGAPANCALQDSGACRASCQCTPIPPRLVEIAALHTHTTYHLAFALQSSPSTMVFLFPCAVSKTACNVSGLASCDVYDWPLALLQAVFHPLQCALAGNVTAGFLPRCHRGRLEGRDLSALRQRCYAARSIVVFSTPTPPGVSTPSAADVAEASTGSVRAVLRTALADDLRQYTHLMSRNPARVASVVCHAHEAMAALAQGGAQEIAADTPWTQDGLLAAGRAVLMEELDAHGVEQATRSFHMHLPELQPDDSVVVPTSCAPSAAASA